MIAEQLVLSNIDPTGTSSRQPRLLAGPDWSAGPEGHADHRARLGRRPVGGEWVVEALEASGLRGRGGAWFPTHRKLRRTLSAGTDAAPILVVNGSEGEPLSRKDQTLICHRPHLIIDGALILAETIGAAEVVVYLSRPSRNAVRALRRALAEREERSPRIPVRLLRTAHRYVSGESSAVASRILGGVAKPTGRPSIATLVQNAETVAHVALIARHGPQWFRETGTTDAPGTALLTLAGAVTHPGVVEVGVGTPWRAVVEMAGGYTVAPRALLVGGYAGAWIDADSADDLRLDPDQCALGCGIVAALARDDCGVAAAAAIVRYMAGESAGQCGPCVFGLGAIARAMCNVETGDADVGDLQRVIRWCRQVDGRGGCHHPGGAVRQVRSAVAVFDAEVQRHLRGRLCTGSPQHPFPKPPKRGRGWR